MLQKLYNVLKEVNPNAAIVLDRLKAFDLVEHPSLLLKLRNGGIKGVSNKLIKN